MSAVSRISNVTMGNANGSRLWQATATVQDSIAGATITILNTMSLAGSISPVAPDSLYLDVLIDNSTTIVKTFTLTPSSAAQTVSFSLTADGTATGAAREGTLRMKIRAINAGGAVGTTYSVDSDGAGTPATGTSITYAGQGWIRGIGTAITSLSGGTTLGTTDTVTATTTITSTPYDSRTAAVAFGPIASTVSAASATTVFLTSLGQIDNRFTVSSNSIGTATTFANATLTGLPWIPSVSAPTITDSTAGAHNASLIGYVNPTIVASQRGAAFGNAIQFDGVVRATATMGFDAGITNGLTVSGPFCLEASIQTGPAVTGNYGIAGRYMGGSVGNGQPFLFVGGSAMNAFIRNTAGTTVLLTGTIAIAANTNYVTALTYDGTTLRLFTNGVLDNSVALSGYEAGDASTRFIIGRNDDLTALSTGGYPFNGIIDEVRLSSVARYTAAYTPATAPFVTDANTLGLWHMDTFISTSYVTETTKTVDPRWTKVGLLQANSNVFGTPPLSKDITGHIRLTTDLGFLSMRYRNVNGLGVNTLSVSHSLVDSGSLTTPVTWSDATATKGSDAGWTNTLQPWSSQLPVGAWTHTATVTAPSNYTGLESGSDALTLAAKNSSYQAVSFLSQTVAGAQGDHAHAGSLITANFSLLNQATGLKVAIDTGTATVSIIRFNNTSGLLEALNTDGTTWSTWSTGAIPTITMTANVTDPLLYQYAFSGAQTTGWNMSSILFFQVLCKVSGTTYGNGTLRELLSAAANGHDKYKFDPLSMIGLGVK